MEHVEVLESLFQILFWNDCGTVKHYASVYTFLHRSDLLQPTAFTVSGCAVL